MKLVDYIPFYREPKRKATVLAQADVVDQRAMSKLFKVAALALGYTGVHNVLGARTTFETAPYDFERILKAVDTDSFVRQGLNKYKELLWKEGWDIVGENDVAVDYVYERIDYMEFAMRRPFQDLLNDIGDQLIKFGNCFLAKARGDLGQFFPGTLSPLDGKDPVVGYYIVPAETVEIKRNKKNKVLSYRQRIDGVAQGFSNRRQPRWAPEDMVHLTWERKPGRAFGTPFLVSVMDDVIALRQMEEDIQNLVHKELFPLYKYKVGTEEHPAEPEEIDHAARELESLRTDGGLVLPDRHDVDVIGAENTALDGSDYLYHFMLRVCVGLGLSPHHLGILLEGGNRAVTDRLDVALYDKIKTYQKYLADMIRLQMFSEILIEGGFDPITHPMVTGESDRCEFRFREIDVDTQVKKETHTLNKYAQNVMTLPETRLALGEDPEADEALLQQAVMARLQPQQVKSANGEVRTEVPEKPDAQQPSKGGSSNPKNTRKGTGNQTRPSNQHGRRTSPNIRRDDDDDIWLTEMVGLIDDEEEDIIDE